MISVRASARTGARGSDRGRGAQISASQNWSAGVQATLTHATHAHAHTWTKPDALMNGLCTHSRTPTCDIACSSLIYFIQRHRGSERNPPLICTQALGKYNHLMKILIREIGISYKPLLIRRDGLPKPGARLQTFCYYDKTCKDRVNMPFLQHIHISIYMVVFY